MLKIKIETPWFEISTYHEDRIIANQILEVCGKNVAGSHGTAFCAGFDMGPLIILNEREELVLTGSVIDYLLDWWEDWYTQRSELNILQGVDHEMENI